MVIPMANMNSVKEKVCALLGSIFIKFKSPVAQYARNQSAIVPCSH